MKRLHLAGVALAAIALTACSNHAPGATTQLPPTSSAAAVAVHTTAPALARPTPTPTPLAWYAQQYLRIVAPANTAIDGMNSDNPSQTQLNDVAAKYRAADIALLRAHWPTPKTQADIETMVRADGAVIADLEQNNGADFARDSETAAADAQVIRAELGLPPVPTS